MSDLKRSNELVDDIWEMVFGTKRRPEKVVIKKAKPKRARTVKGKFKGDDKATKNFNEAWVGGKAPKDLLGLKKKTKRKK